MAALETIASLSAVVSALADVYSIGRDTFDNYLAKRRAEITPDIVNDSTFEFFSSYDDREVKAIERRLLDCRSRFIRDGSGRDRKSCLCSILKEVQSGNNGLPPGVWSDLAHTLGCFKGALEKLNFDR
ncbi:hypothetical protein NKH28_31300 [Mesorhizobium sp. M1227]|uniref:hypothetical protein n=1 Tax=unclassified Mesorhizobium TaxID=325217 RepID=UPI00333DA177